MEEAMNKRIRNKRQGSRCWRYQSGGKWWRKQCKGAPFFALHGHKHVRAVYAKARRGVVVNALWTGDVNAPFVVLP
jgi:hypothetical protein